MNENTIGTLAEAVETGKAKIAAALVQTALDEGADPVAILNDGMVAAMNRVGEKFSAGEAFVPEMLVAARAMKKGMEVLKPHLAAGATDSNGTFVIGTVHGDLHDIGKNLVSMMVESAGFKVLDLGVDVPCETFTAAVANDPDVRIVALSSLLTMTMESMKETVRALSALENRGQFKILVGGAPITQEFCDAIGADGYTSDAAEAAVLAKRLVS